MRGWTAMGRMRQGDWVGAGPGDDTGALEGCWGWNRQDLGVGCGERGRGGFPSPLCMVDPDCPSSSRLGFGLTSSREPSLTAPPWPPRTQPPCSHWSTEPPPTGACLSSAQLRVSHIAPPVRCKPWSLRHGAVTVHELESRGSGTNLGSPGMSCLASLILVPSHPPWE